jgi:hypothetical protein
MATANPAASARRPRSRSDSRCSGRNVRLPLQSVATTSDSWILTLAPSAFGPTQQEGPRATPGILAGKPSLASLTPARSIHQGMLSP